MNWAQYAHDTTHQQLKKVTWPAPSLKHKTTLVVITQSGDHTHKQLGDGRCQDDDCFLIEGMNDFKVFMLHDITQVKKFLEDAKNVE